MRSGHRQRCLSGYLAAFLAAACGSDGEKTYSRAELLEPATCRECHEDHYREWSGSMHAYASKDPVFLAMNARGQRETEGALGDFCVKCHAPMAVNEGASIDDLEALPDELQGVTCYFCHNAQSVEGTHNNPIKLANDVTMRGNITDPVGNRAHFSAYARILDGTNVERSSSMCGSCHDIVVPKELHGGPEDTHLERTFSEWQASLFNKPDSDPQSCAKCHMDPVSNVPIASSPGVVQRRTGRHSHQFPGVDVAVTPFNEMESHRRAVEASLDTSIRVEVCASLQRVITVSLDNVAAGHNLPSGASQDRRLWVELQVFESPGDAAPVVELGVPPAEGIDSIDGGKDTWVLRDYAFDANGEETHMFWNVARTTPATLLAPVTLKSTDPGFHREIDVKEYRWTPERNTAYPDRIVVTLKMTPVARTVLDDLVANGDLAPEIAAEIPTFSIVPNRATGATSTLEWTFRAARTNARGDQLCLETGAGRCDPNDTGANRCPD